MQPMARSPHRPPRRGATLVVVAIVLLVLVGFVGLAVDWGYLTYTAAKMQSAADAAALAGGQWAYYGAEPARAAAIAMAAQNEAGGSDVTLDPNLENHSDGDVVTGIYDEENRTFTPSVTTEPGVLNAVMVHARRTTEAPDGQLPLFFGPIFGKQAADVSRWAVAVTDGGPAYADIVALNRDQCAAFYIYGDSYLNVGNGDGSVHVNSDCTAKNVGGSLAQGTNITFLAGELNVVGLQEERGRPSMPEINEGAMGDPVYPIPDPLANMPEPDIDTAPTYPDRPKITGDGSGGRVEFYPGYYPQGLEMNAGDNVFLHPGVYILDNGFRLNGHSLLEGAEVMFFLHTGSIHDNGTGDVHLSPPIDDRPETGWTDESIYRGIQFFQARDNTEPANFNGGTTWSGMDYDDPSTPTIDESTAGAGTFYFPNAHVEFGGTAGMVFNGLVADTIELYGTGDVHVTGGYNTNDGNMRVWLAE